MIKNIVLDMGNVCCRWDMEYLAKCLTDNKEDKNMIIEKVFQSKQWQLLDQGMITFDEAEKQMCQGANDYQKELIKKVLYHWYDYFDQFDDMEQYIIELKKQGYKIFLLSNCSMQFYKYYQKKSIFSHFDDYYISAKYHLMKPSKTIYLDFLEKFHLKAHECLFVDDMEENVQGATRIGMSGIIYNGSIEELKRNILYFCQ